MRKEGPVVSPWRRRRRSGIRGRRSPRPPRRLSSRRRRRVRRSLCCRIESPLLWEASVARNLNMRFATVNNLSRIFFARGARRHGGCSPASPRTASRAVRALRSRTRVRRACSVRCAGKQGMSFASMRACVRAVHTRRVAAHAASTRGHAPESFRFFFSARAATADDSCIAQARLRESARTFFRRRDARDVSRTPPTTTARRCAAGGRRVRRRCPRCRRDTATTSADLAPHAAHSDPRTRFRPHAAAGIHRGTRRCALSLPLPPEVRRTRRASAVPRAGRCLRVRW